VRALISQRVRRTRVIAAPVLLFPNCTPEFLYEVPLARVDPRVASVPAGAFCPIDPHYTALRAAQSQGCTPRRCGARRDR
jgi:hypothetical protein